jgi:hypothetical protein
MTVNQKASHKGGFQIRGKKGGLSENGLIGDSETGHKPITGQWFCKIDKRN